MDLAGTAPSAADTCLDSSYASRKLKGGTLIEETVQDLATHEERMRDPSSYRPSECACGGTRLHVHERRTRRPRGTTGVASVTVMVFLCASCCATWRVLP